MNLYNSSFPAVAAGNPWQERRALVLGTGEIASGIAVMLHNHGCGVVLSHAPEETVLRRAASFYDALFGDAVCLDGICGRVGDGRLQIERILTAGDAVAVTPLDVMDLLVLGPFDILIDARMQDAAVKPELRWLAGQSFGIGAGWYSGVNCDTALRLPLAETGQQTHVTAPADGVWYSPIEPGTRVYRDLPIGNAGGVILRAPCDGIVMGVLRDGLKVRAGMPVAEIRSRMRRFATGTCDPRGRSVGRQIVASMVARSCNVETASARAAL